MMNERESLTSTSSVTPGNSDFKKRLSQFKTDATARMKRISNIRKVSTVQKSDTSIASETVDLTNYEIDEFDDEPPDCCRNRCDQESQAFVRRVVESSYFNVFLSSTILVNIFFLIAEVLIPEEQDTSESWIKRTVQKYSQMDMMDVQMYLKRMDGIFLSVYLLEFLLKFYVNPVEYWRTWANRLDFIILVFSFAQVIIVEMGEGGGATTGADNGSDTSVSSMRILRTSTNVKIIKTLRAFRALRTLKSLTLVRGAQVILGAIIRSQRKSIADVLGVLFCFLFLMTLLTYSLFYESQPDPKSEEIERTWGCFQATISSLFMIVTCDGWYEIQEALDAQMEGQDYFNRVFARFLMMGIIMIGHFVIFNIFIAVNIMQVQEANQDYNEEVVAEREAILQRKKDKILQRQYDDVKKLREEQEARGCSFHQMIENFKNTLKHEDYTLTEDVITDIEWMTNFSCTLDMLDNTTYKLQQLFFEYTNALIYSQNEELRRRIGT